MKAGVAPASAAALGEIAAWRYERPYDVDDGDDEAVGNPERFFAEMEESE